MSKRRKEIIVYGLAALLMIIRVDLWWWGEKIHPLIFGWITIPMLYQFLIWFAGCALVFYTCIALWDKDPDKA